MRVFGNIEAMNVSGMDWLAEKKGPKDVSHDAAFDHFGHERQRL